MVKVEVAEVTVEVAEVTVEVEAVLVVSSSEATEVKVEALLVE